MRATAPRDLLVVDLEATCDDRSLPGGGAVPKAEMETIEIGAVLVDGETLLSVGEFQTFVRPVRHPELTAFCTRLTTIRQADVEGAPRFPEALGKLRAFLDAHGPPPIFSSWGGYDREQLAGDAGFHGVALPFGGEHLNLKKAFSEALGTRRRFGMAGALRRVGLPLDGTHHRGLDDARNIARLVPWCLGRAQVAPEPPPRDHSTFSACAIPTPRGASPRRVTTSGGRTVKVPRRP